MLEKSKILMYWTALIGFILPITLYSQDTVNVSLTGPASNLNACTQNLFRANFELIGTGPFKISIRDSINLPCGVSNSCNSLNFTFFEVDTIGIDSMVYNNSTGAWEIVLPGGIYSIPYNITVDCSVIPTCFDSIASSLKLFQQWSADSLFFNINGSNDSIFTTPIHYPRLLEHTDPLFYGNYLDTISLIHKYVNSGNADAHIQFSFEIDSFNSCSGIVVDTIVFGIGNDPDSVFYTGLTNGWNTGIVIPMGQNLFINKKVIVIDCIVTDSCNDQQDTFVWQCNLARPEFCDTCQNLLNDSYSIQKNSAPVISIIRMYPDSDGPIKNFSCMGSYIPWKYRIVNSGVVNIAEADINLSFGQYINELNLIDSSSIQLIPYLSPNSTYSSQITLRDTNVLCSTVINSALWNLNINIHNFMMGDSIILEFQTYRCCEENDTLYNQLLSYGSGSFAVSLVDSCPPAIGYTVPSYESYAEWQTQLEYFPTVNTLLVPTDSSFGQATPLLYVDYLNPLTGNNSTYQLFGCTDSASCQLHGYLRVTVHCEQGLLIDTPMVSILNHPLDSIKLWDPIFYYSTNTNSCVPTDYYFYFDLADPNAKPLLHRGRFNFRLKSCCGGLPNTAYEIKFNMLFDPDTCYSINFSDTTHLNPPICSNCCFLPTASVADKIAILCPGCTNPGIEILGYLLKRLSYGKQDSTNNNKADIPIQDIDSAYLATYGSSMRTVHTNHGDIMQDLMTSHFYGGNIDSTGYSYNEMVADSGFLKVLHLDRMFTPEDTVDININPFYLKLYIDIKDTSGTCIDCDEYLIATDYRTIHVIEVDSLQISNYVDYNQTRGSLFFTFDATDSTTNLFQNVIFPDTIGPYEFNGFVPEWKFRDNRSHLIASN